MKTEDKKEQSEMVTVNKKDLIKNYIIDQAWYAIMNYDHGTIAAFKGSMSDLKKLFKKLEELEKEEANDARN